MVCGNGLKEESISLAYPPSSNQYRREKGKRGEGKVGTAKKVNGIVCIEKKRAKGGGPSPEVKFNLEWRLETETRYFLI